MDAAKSPSAGRESRLRLLTACVSLLLISVNSGCMIQRLRADDREELVQAVEVLGGEVIDWDWDFEADIEPAMDESNLQEGDVTWGFSIPQRPLDPLRNASRKISRNINGDIDNVILGDFLEMPGPPDRQLIGDKELQELVRLPAMRRVSLLTLEGTSVTDAGLKYLARLRGLDNIDLRNTRVTAEGAKRLKLALPNCQITI